MSSGYIYVMYNPAYREDLVKIGKTEVASNKRAKELFSGQTGVPDKFIVAFEMLVDDCHLVEKVVHEELREYRYNERREFFQIPLKYAIMKVQEIVERYCYSQQLTSINKWLYGKAYFDFSLLPETVCSSNGILPIRCSLDATKGTEVSLVYLDQTSFIYEIAEVEPFNLFLRSGIIRTEYGPLCFHVFSIRDPKDSRKPLLIIDSFLDPFNTNGTLLWRDLSRQTHWHLFLINNQKEQVGFREFKNHFRLDETLDLIDQVFQSITPQEYDFELAKQEIVQQYTPQDLFELTGD